MYCVCITHKGTRCTNSATHGEYCGIHWKNGKSPCKTAKSGEKRQISPSEKRLENYLRKGYKFESQSSLLCGMHSLNNLFSAAFLTNHQGRFGIAKCIKFIFKFTSEQLVIDSTDGPKINLSKLCRELQEKYIRDQIKEFKEKELSRPEEERQKHQSDEELYRDTKKLSKALFDCNNERGDFLLNFLSYAVLHLGFESDSQYVNDRSPFSLKDSRNTVGYVANMGGSHYVAISRVKVSKSSLEEAWQVIDSLGGAGDLFEDIEECVRDLNSKGRLQAILRINLFDSSLERDPTKEKPRDSLSILPKLFSKCEREGEREKNESEVKSSGGGGVSTKTSNKDATEEIVKSIENHAIRAARSVKIPKSADDSVFKDLPEVLKSSGIKFSIEIPYHEEMIDAASKIFQSEGKGKSEDVKKMLYDSDFYKELIRDLENLKLEGRDWVKRVKVYREVRAERAATKVPEGPLIKSEIDGKCRRYKYESILKLGYEENERVKQKLKSSPFAQQNKNVINNVCGLVYTLAKTDPVIKDIINNGSNHLDRIQDFVQHSLEESLKESGITNTEVSTWLSKSISFRILRELTELPC